MQRLTLALPGNEDFAGRLAQAYGSDVGRVETRRFPDGESYVRLHGEPVGQIVDLICTLPIQIRNSCFWFLPRTPRASLVRSR